MVRQYLYGTIFLVIDVKIKHKKYRFLLKIFEDFNGRLGYFIV